MTEDKDDPLAVALVDAQSEMKNAAFNRVNPHFKSKYADLAALREATLPALNAHGLSIIQLLGFVDGIGFCIHTRLLHTSGRHEDAFYPIAQGTPQQMGSAITYGRRYSWSAICGVASDDDDDANAAESLPINKSDKSAYRARKDGDDERYKELSAEMFSKETRHELKEWGLSVKEIIAEWPDGWQKHFRDQYEHHMQGLVS